MPPKGQTKPEADQKNRSLHIPLTRGDFERLVRYAARRGRMVTTVAREILQGALAAEDDGLVLKKGEDDAAEKVED